MKEKPMTGAARQDSGFTLIEVLVSIMLTMIVMGAVFGLLTRGQRSFEREPEIADLQQSARSALDTVSKDIMQAGAGLPPEIPFFTTTVGEPGGRPAGDDGSDTDIIEIIGAFQRAGGMSLEPEPINSLSSVSGRVFTMQANTTNFQQGDLVLAYNNVRNNLPLPNPPPRWLMGVITSIAPGPPVQITVDDSAVDTAYNSPFGADSDYDARALMTPISVVRYYTQDAQGTFTPPVPQVLMRQVDFQPASPVGFVEDFEVAYVIGNPPPPLPACNSTCNVPTVTGECCDNPPAIPIATGLTVNNTLTGVRVTVAARSMTAGMEGATEGASAGREDDFIRRTFSTNVNPRNLTAGVDAYYMTTIP